MQDPIDKINAGFELFNRWADRAFYFFFGLVSLLAFAGSFILALGFGGVSLLFVALTFLSLFSALYFLKKARG